ncbi:recombinase family protein [Methylobacterium sp. P31]
MSKPKTRRPTGHAIATAVRQARADAFAARVLPIIASIKAGGVETDYGIAAALNQRGIPTPKGGKWQTVQVQRVLKRTA